MHLYILQKIVHSVPDDRLGQCQQSLPIHERPGQYQTRGGDDDLVSIKSKFDIKS